MTDEPVRYPVDITAADNAVERIKAHVRSTFRPEVIGDLGGFGGLFSFEPAGMDQPVLVASTDGVGTKSQIARLTGRYDTIGIDLVAMSVDDLAVQGAEPLFFLDYISTGKADPDIIDALVSGVAHGCRTAGCALIGGEISEHPGLMEPGDFDLVGFAVGVVARDRLLPRDVAPGDHIIGIRSPGLRCNGYALARAALLERCAKHGIDGTRVRFIDYTASRRDHLACYHQVHVALDTTPYNGTTTTCEALWMGVPVVTTLGDRHVSRVSASLLRASGLTEWVAETPDAFARIVASLAADRAGLAERRMRQRAELATTPVFDAPDYARRFHEALRTACAGA